MALVKVCAVSEVLEGQARRFEVNGEPIAVANLGDAGFRAVGAVCSHAQFFLDEGEVDPDLETIECPKHGSTFDLNTGKPKTLPATLPVPVYDVEVEDDQVLIEVDE